MRLLANATLLAAVLALSLAGSAAAQALLTVEDFDDLTDWTSDGYVDVTLADSPLFQGTHAASLTFRSGDTWAALSRSFSSRQDWSGFSRLRMEVYPTAAVLDGVFSPTVKVMTGSEVLLEERRGGLMLNQWNTITLDLGGIDAADLAQVTAIELYQADVTNPGSVTFLVDYLRLVPGGEPDAGCRTEILFTSNAVMAFDYWTLEVPSVPIRYRTRWAGTESETEMGLAEEAGVRFYYAAASSDYPQFDGLSLYRDEATEVLPALDRPMCVGLYLHELATYLSGSIGWDWPTAIGIIDWGYLDRIVSAAAARGKRMIWSEPGYAWETIYGDAGAVGWIQGWGDAVVVMFATNFPDQIWNSREYAYALAGRLGIELGDSVQAWYFDDLGIPYDRMTTVWLFALGYGSGARVFQLEGAEGAFDLASPFMQGTTDFIGMVRDPACITAIEISGIGVTGVTETQATIQWTTNVAADSRVEYGPAPDYGSRSPLDPAYTPSHAVALSGLAPFSLYHFRVRSADPSANAAVSEDLTFTTAGGEIEDDAGEETGPEPADAEDSVDESPDSSVENPDMPDIPDTVGEADAATDGSTDPADADVEAGGGDGGCSCSLVLR
jgi:hypothetical protein